MNCAFKEQIRFGKLKKTVGGIAKTMLASALIGKGWAYEAETGSHSLFSILLSIF